MKRRKILVILSNRWHPSGTPRFIEVECDEKGNIFKERPLRRAPARPRYDEVWENDQAKTDFASCHRFKRRYGHKLQKPR